jgi:hypothetical protein
MAKGRKPIPKTQKEISESLQTPYEPPVGSPGFSPTGNPNDADKVNRGNQSSYKGDTVKPLSIGLEDLDWAIMYYFQNVIKPSVLQNGEKVEVPVIYGSPEKWKSFQKDGYYRDLQGKIMAPIIMFKRNNIERDRALSNKLDANNPHNVAVTGKRYSKQNAYSKFNILNGIKPEETYYATVVPDYLTVTYECIISTYYNDQLNHIIEAIGYAADAYWGDPERFKFKTNIDSFTTSAELADAGERLVRGTFGMRMHGYIVPDTIQKDTTFISKFSNRNKLVITTEVVTNIEDLKNNPNL